MTANDLVIGDVCPITWAFRELLRCVVWGFKSKWKAHILKTFRLTFRAPSFKPKNETRKTTRLTALSELLNPTLRSFALHAFNYD